MKTLVNEQIFKNFISEELDSETTVFDQLLSIFTEYVLQLQELTFIGSPENLDEIERTAHKLRSCCGSFGAIDLAEKLHWLELAAEFNKLDDVQTGLNECAQMAVFTLQSIEQLYHTYKGRDS